MCLRVCVISNTMVPHIVGDIESNPSYVLDAEETDGQFLIEQVAKYQKEDNEFKLANEKEKKDLIKERILNNINDNADLKRDDSVEKIKQIKKELREKKLLEDLGNSRGAGSGGGGGGDHYHPSSIHFPGRGHEKENKGGIFNSFFNKASESFTGSHHKPSPHGEGGGPPVPGSDIPLGFRDDISIKWTPQQVMKAHRQLFEDLPEDGFDDHYKNPCWSSSSSQTLDLEGEGEEGGGGGGGGSGHRSGNQHRRDLLLTVEEEYETYENVSYHHSRSLLKRPPSHRFAKHDSRSKWLYNICVHLCVYGHLLLLFFFFFPLLDNLKNK
jgi:hypothetical protein